MGKEGRQPTNHIHLASSDDLQVQSSFQKSPLQGDHVHCIECHAQLHLRQRIHVLLNLCFGGLMAWPPTSNLTWLTKRTFFLSSSYNLPLTQNHLSLQVHPPMPANSCYRISQLSFLSQNCPLSTIQ